MLSTTIGLLFAAVCLLLLGVGIGHRLCDRQWARAARGFAPLKASDGRLYHVFEDAPGLFE